jgi:single-stranded DNA-binding protein
MPMKTSMSMSGFVATTPQLTQMGDGQARCYLRVGQEHYTRNMDGSFTQGENSFHDMVVFRKTAERAASMLAKGDRFIAEGYTHSFQLPNEEGVNVAREEFVARKIGHDMAHTTYAVDRTSRVRQGPTNTCPGADLTPMTADPLAVGI